MKLTLILLLATTFAFAEGTPIVTLKKRDKTITIKTSPEGKLYTIKDKKGNVLAEDLTEDQLQATNRELHNLVKSGIAGKQYLDATNDATKPEARQKP